MTVYSLLRSQVDFALYDQGCTKKQSCNNVVDVKLKTTSKPNRLNSRLRNIFNCQLQMNPYGETI